MTKKYNSIIIKICTILVFSFLFLSFQNCAQQFRTSNTESTTGIDLGSSESTTGTDQVQDVGTGYTAPPQGGGPKTGDQNQTDNSTTDSTMKDDEAETDDNGDVPAAQIVPVFGFYGTTLKVDAIDPISQRYEGSFEIVMRRLLNATTEYTEKPSTMQLQYSYVQKNGNVFVSTSSASFAEGQYDKPFIIQNLPKDIKCEDGVALITIKYNSVDKGRIYTEPDAAFDLVVRKSPHVYHLGCPPEPTIAAPTNLKVTGTGRTYMNLQWDAVPGALSYSLARDGVIVAKDIKNSYYSDQNLMDDQTYTYEVYAINNDSASYKSNTISNKTSKAEVVFGLFSANPDPVAHGNKATIRCYMGGAAKVVIYQGSEVLVSTDLADVLVDSKVVSNSVASSKEFKCEGYLSADSSTPDVSRTFTIAVTQTADTTAPTNPSNIRINQTSVSSFDMRWDASVDASPVRYRLYWQTELNPIGYIGEDKPLEEPVFNIPAGQRKNMKFWLQAVDSAGNVSGKVPFTVDLLENF